jgi:hypothetical protein
MALEFAADTPKAFASRRLPLQQIGNYKIKIYGDGAGTGTTILFGGGGGCIRQSINFHTAITTSITAPVAIQNRVARSFALITYH